MGPWQSSNPSYTPLPNPGGGPSGGGGGLVNTIVYNVRTRPLRSTLIAVSGMLGLMLVSAAAGGPGNDHLKSAWNGRPGTVGLDPGGSGTFAAPGGGTPSTGFSPLNPIRYDPPPDSAMWDPKFEIDPNSGLLYPPDINPARMNSFRRANATIVSLVRNRELEGMKNSMRSFEARINRKLGYPWVFLNDEPFTDEFKREISKMTRSKVSFGVVPPEHWSYPEWIDQDRAARERKKLADEHILYGDSESYRHMCRYQSGFFFHHSLMTPYKYYWRVEPDVDFYCDVDYDPFLFMEANKKKYAFTISFVEFKRTVETLWTTVQEFLRANPSYVVKDSAMKFIMDDTSRGIEGDYNLCHFWTNFEIADADFWRSKEYTEFFNHLDRSGGFFYERWGDAPVHSIAASLFMKANEIHHFDDISYRHTAYTHCPSNQDLYHKSGRCNCDPSHTVELDWVSCQAQWYRVGPKPPKKTVFNSRDEIEGGEEQL